MFHDPNGDHLEISTNELVCVLINRLDAPRSLFSLLGLMVEMSEALPIDRKWRMACTLRDAAAMIEERHAFEEGTTRC
jgi:hypothetical protein